MASSAINAIGVTLATRGAICAASAVCPPLGAALGLGIAAYSVASLAYDHWDTLSHHASTYANEGFTAGNAELSRSISNTINEFAQASDFDKGDMTMSAVTMFVGGKSGKTKARNVVNGGPDGKLFSSRLNSSAVACDSIAANTLRHKKLDLDALSRSGQLPDRAGLTKAGRSLDKHGNRPGTPFPKAVGNPLSKNAQGQYHLDDILTDPKSLYIDLHVKGFEIFTPSGRGAHFRPDGTFRGFVQ